MKVYVQQASTHNENYAILVFHLYTNQEYMVSLGLGSPHNALYFDYIV